MRTGIELAKPTTGRVAAGRGTRRGAGHIPRKTSILLCRSLLGGAHRNEAKISSSPLPYPRRNASTMCRIFCELTTRLHWQIRARIWSFPIISGAIPAMAPHSCRFDYAISSGFGCRSDRLLGAVEVESHGVSKRNPAAWRAGKSSVTPLHCACLHVLYHSSRKYLPSCLPTCLAPHRTALPGCCLATCRGSPAVSFCQAGGTGGGAAICGTCLGAACGARVASHS